MATDPARITTPERTAEDRRAQAVRGTAEHGDDAALRALELEQLDCFAPLAMTKVE
jgi:hypothetical protein